MGPGRLPRGHHEARIGAILRGVGPDPGDGSLQIHEGLGKGGARAQPVVGRQANPAALGQVIELVLKEDKACQDLNLKAWVVRLSPNGIGVKFDRRLGRDRRKNSDRRDRRTGNKNQGDTR